MLPGNNRGPLVTAVNARTFSSSLTPPRRLCTVHNMSNAKAAQDAKPLDFEAAMRDLEELVERLEHGDLPLEESLAAFERGVMLTRSCQAALKEAEQKVEILLKKAGESRVEDFNADETKAT
jgi:exodeoxyribonuclease VII small subunit